MSEVQHGQEQQVPEAESFEAAFAQLDAENQSQTPNPGSGEGDENPNPDPNDPLATLDLPALLSHETLGPKLKSYADTEHANQSRGMQDKWQQDYEATRVPQIQRQVTEQLLGTWFDELDEGELGSYLAANPNLAAAYASHKATQEASKNPPPNPGNQVSPETALILGRIRAVNQRMETAGLPDEVRTKLDPSNYRNQGSEGLTKWETDVDEAVVAHKVKLQTSETLEAKRTAELAESDSASALMMGGQNTNLLGDLENDPPQLLMERALQIDAAARKR